MLCESCTCPSFAEPEWSSLCCRQLAPMKFNTVWGTIIISSKIKACHVQYWQQNGNAWKRRLSIEIYTVQRANVHSAYWQQNTQHLLWRLSFQFSLCLRTPRHMYEALFHTSAQTLSQSQCHCSAESANAAIWLRLTTAPGACALRDTNFKLLV